VGIRLQLYHWHWLFGSRSRVPFVFEGYTPQGHRIYMCPIDGQRFVEIR
jgi:hypothetical protein